MLHDDHAFDEPQSASPHRRSEQTHTSHFTAEAQEQFLNEASNFWQDLASLTKEPQTADLLADMGALDDWYHSQFVEDVTEHESDRSRSHSAAFKNPEDTSAPLTARDIAEPIVATGNLEETHNAAASSDIADLTTFWKYKSTLSGKSCLDDVPDCFIDNRHIVRTATNNN